jgi:outer membrane protein assembly factor BamB
MFRAKINLFFYLISAVAIISGCSSILRNNAFTYRQPLTDPDIYVDVYKLDKACNGNTLFADIHRPQRPRIIEVNMQGQIIWEYVLPQNLRQYTNPGFDVEWLPNNNVLFVLPLKGVYEINRDGDIVWSYLNKNVSHDADRLPNGNTLVVFGGWDQISDAQVKEIDPKGEIVWAWYAKDQFDRKPYKNIQRQGWVHTNAVSRLPNGCTLISLRNFDRVIEVDPQGEIVWSFDCRHIGRHPHEPEIQPGGTMLFAARRHRWDPAIEIDRETGEIVWEFHERGLDLLRDVDRLPNGNTLVVGRDKIIEATPDREIVWRLRVKGLLETKSPRKRSQRPNKFLYKAERIPAQQ